MTKLIKITAPEELASLNEFIHDCQFDMEEIVFDSVASTLELSFRREALDKGKITRRFFLFKKISVPITLWSMKFAHVESYEILEGRQPGPGSEEFLNILTYDELSQEIWIKTIIRKGLLVKVRSLELSAEETEKVVEIKTSFSIFL